MEPERPALLRDKEVCNLLNIGRTKYYEMAASGELPTPIRLGKSVRIARVALDRWIEQRQAEAEAGARG